MKVSLPQPINDTQREFKRLCELGGGTKGGPARGKVFELLRDSGRRLNAIAYKQTAEHLGTFKEANPWHVCFGIGLAWGHLAKFEVDFTGSVVALLENWTDDNARTARSFHLERGPDPIEHSLVGAYQLFSKVLLPPKLPNTLRQLGDAQQRWLTPIISKDRPRYIGSWNATAMFMIALFAQPSLADTLLEPPPMLPPGGPINAALIMLHKTYVSPRRPAGTDLDDEAFEPGALYENNGLLAELLRGLSGWSLIDLHTGLYLLGTRDPRSATWA